MKRPINIILLTILTLSMLTSCMQKKVDGIIIGSDLYEMQDYSSNRKLCGIIKKTLDNDPQGLIELTGYWCGGATGCYDLGYVLTQIIYKTGEKEFIKLTADLSPLQKNQILGFIAVGLEYGDNNYDGKMDDTTIDKTFPELEKALNFSSNNNVKCDNIACDTIDTYKLTQLCKDTTIEYDLTYKDTIKLARIDGEIYFEIRRCQSCEGLQKVYIYNHENKIIGSVLIKHNGNAKSKNIALIDLKEYFNGAIKIDWNEHGKVFYLTK